jgi:phosphatidylglycerol:prolipoprotein diacylglycerol transferase
LNPFDHYIQQCIHEYEDGACKILKRQGGVSSLTPNPILISIGSVSIRWYGVLIVAGFLLGAFLALREARRQGWNPDHFLNVLLVVMPAALVGARLYYVLFNWSYYQQHMGEIPATWLGGLAFHGGLFGALAAFVFHWPVKVVLLIILLDEVVKVPVCLIRYRSRRWLNNVTR